MGAKYVWTATIEKLKTSDEKLKADLTNLVAGTKAFTEEVVQAHAPLISGTFSLTIASNQVKLYSSTTGAYT